jgi:hypothetical protein
MRVQGSTPSGRGCSFRPMMRIAVPLVLLLTFAAACGGSQPDRVVGVVLKCSGPFAGGTGEFSGEECNSKVATGTRAGQYDHGNRRLVITMKPASGASYTAELPPDANVAVGNKWPPD